MAQAILERADAREAGRDQILGRVARDVGRDDREGRYLGKMAFEILEPELDVGVRLLACLGDMRERADTPVAPVRRSGDRFVDRLRPPRVS
jgi:hypothetical protein